jgi:hypothetical protein
MYVFGTAPARLKALLDFRYDLLGLKNFTPLPIMWICLPARSAQYEAKAMEPLNVTLLSLSPSHTSSALL